jgi:tungstate transport system substrate-binding protein
MRRVIQTLLGLCLAMGLMTSAQAQERFIILASTTSTEHSGLLGHLIPQFRQATGIDVRVVAAGTGQAFALGRRGDADALLVHDAAGEQEFVAEGYGRERREVMYNDFVLVGPVEDPARVRQAKTAVQALTRIAEQQAPFASRGDDSGTHRAEQRIWRLAGVRPAGRWYRSLGSGMGQTLNTAAAMDAYTLADRGTWVSFDNRQNLQLLFEGDPPLFNQYSSLLIDKARHPHLKHALAEQWHRWLLSKEGQAAIAAFKLRDQSLFFPNAHRADTRPMD